MLQFKLNKWRNSVFDIEIRSITYVDSVLA